MNDQEGVDLALAQAAEVVDGQDRLAPHVIGCILSHEENPQGCHPV
jgi:hypothetical protein